MSLVRLVDLELLGDERGHLVVLEGSKNVEFEIKRVYYLTDTTLGTARGFHAHRKLHQIAVCVSGSCRMIMDNGVRREGVLLDSPRKAIKIPPMIWHEMHDFSRDCVLLVLANDYYDESDYIRKYHDFLDLVALR